MIYAIAVIALGVIGFLIWWGIRERKAGKSAQREADLDKAVKVEKRMSDAAAGAPSSVADVVDAARKGEF